MPQNNYDNSSMTSQELLDSELERCVKELMRNSHENYSGVEVHVDAQKVYFSGALESEKARKHLDDLATMVQGLDAVINEVTLKH
jgi:osmotically-inducible protein OsmY